MRAALNALIRFLIIWIISTLSIMVTSWLVPGIALYELEGFGTWQVAAAVAFVLGLANLLVRPLILLLAMPLGFIALFVVGFFVNAIVMLLAANLLGSAFEVRGWLAAVIGSLVLSLVTSLLMSILNVDDQGSFYEGVIARRLGRQRVDLPANPTRGLVMVEIDGLSYHHIRRAIADGYMPNVKRLIDQHGYVLSRTDCGLPSQTSACQAGILFGDNFDIPAFRWYDKRAQRLFVSGNDAALINGRYATGNGLLRGGTSVNNMVNGDATLSLLTASDLRGGTSEQKSARARDVYTLLLNPNFFMRAIGLFLGEALLEVGQYVGDVVRGVQPRLNRLHKFYPFVRAATTVFMREVSGYLTLMQIVRGEPAMYTTWPGYDEVAHHSGPWSKHAFSTLSGFDRFIGTVLETIETKAPRPYEFLLLSDHGQSFGPTFLMRYGYTLKDFIEHQMPAGTVVRHTTGGDDGSLSVIAMAEELGNIQSQGLGGRVGQAATRQMRRAADAAVAARGAEDQSALVAQSSDVTFCGSGNLAQVYFHAFTDRASLSQLNSAYPGMVDAVVQHEGVGLVAVADDAGVPIVFGKRGARNLHTGEITGEDPLAAYGDVGVRARQLGRLAGFPATGDLIVISTLYPDGTVAAMEELIGNHGGLGGEQTDSFLLHPADLQLPDICGAYELFAVLDARRELPAPALVAEPVMHQRDDWAPSNLVHGLSRVGDWVGLALRAAILDRAAFREIAARGDMTGPALLLALAGSLGAAFADHHFVTVAGHMFQTLLRVLFWLLSSALIHGAARIARGKGSYTQTARVLGFAQTANVLGWLAAVPMLGDVIPLLTTLLTLLATWLGVAQAHRLGGWRTLSVPAIFLTVALLGLFATLGLVGGLDAVLVLLATRFGLMR